MSSDSADSARRTRRGRTQRKALPTSKPAAFAARRRPLASLSPGGLTPNSRSLRRRVGKIAAEQRPRRDATYECVRRIGSGAHGDVWVGRDASGAKIAIKTVRFRVRDAAGHGAALVLELTTLRACDHANIVKYIDCVVQSTECWICMELCSGGSASALVRLAGGALADPVLSTVLRDVLAGLAYLHARGMAHRDIKAANVLLTDAGVAKLGDFGLACALGEGAPQALGTPLWLAPELLRADAASHSCSAAAADVWAWGIVAIELADGRPPHADLHPLRALCVIPDVPAPRIRTRKARRALRRTVARALVKAPAKRASAADLLRAGPLATPPTAQARRAIVELLARRRADGRLGAGSGSAAEHDENALQARALLLSPGAPSAPTSDCSMLSPLLRAAAASPSLTHDTSPAEVRVVHRRARARPSSGSATTSATSATTGGTSGTASTSNST